MTLLHVFSHVRAAIELSVLSAHVTFPMITPTTFFLLVLGTIGSLQIFDIFYVMTQGGPAGSTTALSYYIYNKMFQDLDMGYAAAISWVLWVCSRRSSRPYSRNKFYPSSTS